MILPGKAIKILSISLLSFLSIFIILILLLSIFFPREFVREELEKIGSSYIKSELKIGKLDFSIFTGIELDNSSIKNHKPIWEKQDILSVKKMELKYDLFRL